MRYLFLLFPLFLLTACDDDDSLQPTIPPNETPLEELNRRVPITQEGAGTFGCLINGEVWTNRPGGGGSDEDLRAQYYYPLNSFTVFAIRYYEDTFNANDDFFSIRLIPIERYSVGNHTSAIETHRLSFNTPPVVSIDYPHSYRIDTLMPYGIQVSSFEENYVSAEFEMTFISEDFSDTLTVTNGRFDVTYTAYY